MSTVLGLQRRMMLLGRVRLGEKGPKGEPRKRETFRLTSASRTLLEAASSLYGGTVTEWKDAPDEGYFELATDAAELNIILPPVFAASDGTPTVPFSQAYELWKAGGCERRCDGETELLSGKPCLCDPDDRSCQITTRVSFILPDIPGLGVWRLDSRGWNAAVELPGTLEVLLMAAAERQFIPAVLRIEARTKKVPGEGTRRFVVPVIDLPSMRIADMLPASTDRPLLNAPTPAAGKPALPAAPDVPAEPAEFTHDEMAGWGTAPVLPEPVEESQTVVLTSRLYELSDLFGADRAMTIAAVEKNRTKHASRPDLHESWLGKQIATLEKNIAARDAAAGQSAFKAPAGTVAG